jgi:hypothetical protein
MFYLIMGKLRRCNFLQNNWCAFPSKLLNEHIFEVAEFNLPNVNRIALMA